MDTEKPIVHPYIPNSVPEVQAEMLSAIGVEDIEELYREIPDHLRFKGRLNLPRRIRSEYGVKKHVKRILSKNKTCEEYLSFIGAGCWQHYVPAVCDEIVGRSEVLTAYAGKEYSDFGKFQLFFEYQSQLGELIGMDVVSLPVYSWGSAAGSAIRMAWRMTGRDKVLLPKTISPERLGTIKTLCGHPDMPAHINVVTIDYDTDTGLLDLNDLNSKLSDDTAAVYIENPSYLGFIESQSQEVFRMAHDNGAIAIAGVDPISLGIIAPPLDYGADIVVGTLQPLGVHMNCGGGTAGFIASRDEEQYVAEYPSLMVTATDTIVDGELGFGWCTWERTGYVPRDSEGQIRKESKDFIGTTCNLWAIASAVYMTLMGPQGFKELGETIIQKAQYAIKLISQLDGVKVLFGRNGFKEFVVNFDATDKTVGEINKALLEYGIFGGKDISAEFPELGNSALYCVTEIHIQEDIHRLVNTLKEVVSR